MPKSDGGRDWMYCLRVSLRASLEALSDSSHWKLGLTYLFIAMKNLTVFSGVVGLIR
jgi:hypothetical protein